MSTTRRKCLRLLSRMSPDDRTQLRLFAINSQMLRSGGLRLFRIVIYYGVFILYVLFHSSSLVPILYRTQCCLLLVSLKKTRGE